MDASFSLVPLISRFVIRIAPFTFDLNAKNTSMSCMAFMRQLMEPCNIISYEDGRVASHGFFRKVNTRHEYRTMR